MRRERERGKMERTMKRLILSVVLAIALFTSRAVVTQFSMGDVAYAESGD